MSDGELLLVVGALLTAGLAAAVVAGRVRLPGLLLFLGVGMAVGSDGTGWIRFDDYDLAQSVGVVALALILYEGGLNAGWSEIRPVLVPSLVLAIAGTTLTAVLGGLIAQVIFGLSTLEGLLLGSIVAATDGAAIFALLRGSTLQRRVARTLEGEAGFNDPVAVLLVTGFVAWITEPHYGIADLLVLFVEELGIGAVVGVVVGRVAVLALERVPLTTAGLYPVASIAIGALAFGSADVLHGSGFLSVYLTGLAIGGSTVPAKRTMVTFHEGLGWVAQIAMFFTLGLLVFPSQLGDVAFEGTLLGIAAAAVARPLAVMATTFGSGFRTAERVVLGWAGLRGAVPVVLATFPVLASVPDSLRFFNIVFFAVLVSTVVQGTTFEALAKRLGVTTDEAALPAPLIEPATIRRLGAEVVEFAVQPGHAAVGAAVRDLGLPRDALLNLIVRDDGALPPRGSTRILAGDRLHVLIRQESAVEFRTLLARWRTGPIGPAARPARTPRSSPSIFTTRPWREVDGDATRPDAVNGLEVVTQVRTRRDRPGAVVELADGRWAVTGPVLLLGSGRQVNAEATRRLRRATDDAETAWWSEVTGALGGYSGVT